MPRPFRLVDVFADAPFSGNPLAVIADAEGLETDEMQRITRWLNLSETTFLLPPTTPDADYRVRIFTLERELPFAGHPTLGTCHAWLDAGGVPRDAGRIVQECGAGLVSVRRDASGLAFAAPKLLRSGTVDPALVAEIAAVLRIDIDEVVEAQWADNGPGWVALLLRSAEAVLAVDPIRHHDRRWDLGIVGPHPAGGDAAYEVRAFFTDPLGNLLEDPVCGSLNASVAQWLVATGRATAPWTATQGVRVDRDGRIRITQDVDGQLWIGGATRTLFVGQTGF